VLPLFLAATIGCDDKSANTPKPGARSESVTAKTGQPAPPASARPAPMARPTKPPRKLCDGQTLRDPPKTIEAARSIEGTPSLPPLRYGEGKWIWVNVWAAWCKPCKDEIPVLVKWREKLRAAGAKLDIAFVSLDDDQREMKRFMKTQPEGGLRASYWLVSDEERDAWFESVGFEDTPQLPLHALVNPEGKLACVIKGAVEHSDYPALAALFGVQKK
jgi:thiol-disulfide isomerase/thioredoxin